jgi:hypothetical protein
VPRARAQRDPARRPRPTRRATMRAQTSKRTMQPPHQHKDSPLRPMRRRSSGRFHPAARSQRSATMVRRGTQLTAAAAPSRPAALPARR